MQLIKIVNTLHDGPGGIEWSNDETVLGKSSPGEIFVIDHTVDPNVDRDRRNPVLPRGLSDHDAAHIVDENDEFDIGNEERDRVIGADRPFARQTEGQTRRLHAKSSLGHRGLPRSTDARNFSGKRAE